MGRKRDRQFTVHGRHHGLEGKDLIQLKKTEVNSSSVETHGDVTLPVKSDVCPGRTDRERARVGIVMHRGLV